MAPLPPVAETESLAELIDDCLRMAPHWEVPAAASPAAVAPSSLHGITGPAESAHVVDGMADYGSGAGD
jgi:hypothetical protein